jgi:hypothetical protein
MRRAEANTDVNRRKRMIALCSLGITLASIPLFVVSYISHFDLGMVFFGVLWFAAAMIWSPTLTYVGVRTRSRLVTVCGLIGTITSAYWVWIVIYWQ